jgi:hypothetical protein
MKNNYSLPADLREALLRSSKKSFRTLFRFSLLRISRSFLSFTVRRLFFMYSSILPYIRCNKLRFVAFNSTEWVA